MIVSTLSSNHIVFLFSLCEWTGCAASLCFIETVLEPHAGSPLLSTYRELLLPDFHYHLDLVLLLLSILLRRFYQINSLGHLFNARASTAPSLSRRLRSSLHCCTHLLYEIAKDVHRYQLRNFPCSQDVDHDESTKQWWFQPCTP